MPNYCSYVMKVKGKKLNVEEFIKVMQADYNYLTMKFSFERHMGGRVFDATVTEIVKEEDDYIVMLNGDCAWSVDCCMRNSTYSYYRNFLWDYGKECKSTTLELESKRLKLKIEVFSEEPGMCFAEHYCYDNGNLICEEIVDYNEYPIYEFDNKEDAEKEYDIEITDYEFANEEWIHRGGFEQVFSF